jgi:hypothetical protein
MRCEDPRGVEKDEELTGNRRMEFRIGVHHAGVPIPRS